MSIIKNNINSKLIMIYNYFIVILRLLVFVISWIAIDLTFFLFIKKIKLHIEYTY